MKRYAKIKVYIRPLQENDAKTSYVWRNDPEIWKYTGSSPSSPVTFDDELRWIKRVIDDKSSRRFAIIVGGEYVGNIYLTGIHNNEAEYHIFIGNKDYMGKGIAKIASKQIIDFAREELHLHRIKLEVKRENNRAVQLYARLGFKEQKEDQGVLTMTLNLSF